MDNYRGDLADILGACGRPIKNDGNMSGEALVENWHFQPVPNGNYENQNCDYFGDPFSCIKDPLLEELDVPKSTLFHNSTDITKQSVVFSPKVRPSNSFSRMVQISPDAKVPISSDVNKTSHNLVINSPNSSKTCFVGNPVGLQISSPRITGIKRRKSQAKKVVFIPATTPANTRSSGGEVVPSDLWAWRKYGQKPIKGSPYPRGYYRCSSSKGCSARKQVERSRNDSSMLVITYTSEHNHPLPTQRNALAGSTRSHPSKANSSPKSTSRQAQKEPSLHANMKEEPNTNDTNIAANEPTVKEERKEFDNDIELMDLNDDYTSYRPLLPPDMLRNNHSDGFFAELGEIGDDDDTLKMFFSTTEGFPSDHEEIEKDKGLDAFPSFFEWIGISDINNNANDTPTE